MKHYKSVEFLSIFRVSSPAQTQSHPAEMQSPPIENFLATVPVLLRVLRHFFISWCKWVV